MGGSELVWRAGSKKDNFIFNFIHFEGIFDFLVDLVVKRTKGGGLW
jgi:hypothetical protein